MVRCQHCGNNPGPEGPSAALRKVFAEQRQYRLHRAFVPYERPGTHHGAIRIEIVRLDADRRSIRKVRRLALRQIARYWRKCSELQRQYAKLRTWMNEVQAELDRRGRPRRRQASAAGVRSVTVRRR
jgi:hypothetical protein